METSDRFVSEVEFDESEQSQPATLNKMFLGGAVGHFSAEIDEDGADSDGRNLAEDNPHHLDDRKVVRTQAFGRKDTLKVLLLAIPCALEEVATSEL